MSIGTQGGKSMEKLEKVGKHLVRLRSYRACGCGHYNYLIQALPECGAVTPSEFNDFGSGYRTLGEATDEMLMKFKNARMGKGVVK